MSASGAKRPYDAPEPERRIKPRDWRDAFLDDEPDRARKHERERDRSRGYERDYRDRDRGYDRGGERDRRDYDRRERDERPRERERERERDWDYRDRERERGGRRDERERDRDRRRSDDRRAPVEREEGEIDSPPRGAPNATMSPARSDAAYSASARAYPDPRARTHTRSPPRHRAGHTHVPTQPRRFEAERAEPTGTGCGAAGSSFSSATAPAAGAAQADGKLQHAPATEPEMEPEVELESEDPEKILEERRKKREAILAKYRDKPSPVALSPAALPPQDLSGAESVNSGGMQTGFRTGASTGATPLLLQALGTRSVSAASVNATTPVVTEPSLASTPLGHDFDLTKQADTAGGDVIPPQTRDGGVGADQMVSAADYDPARDGEADRSKVAPTQARTVADGVGEPVVADDEYEDIEVEVEDEDDDFDMFAAFGGAEPAKKKRTVTVRRVKGSAAPVVAKPTVLEVVDNLDDSEGYYRITPGEVIDNGRYQITTNLGKGMFSAVVKAKVLKAVGQERHQDVVGKEVAIKFIRSQESMYVAGRKEVQILQKLNAADPEDKKHIVRLERTFEHRGHLCIVTESLSMNLRDVIKRFGKDVGLNMRAVRAYAHQMLLALSLMRKCNLVHADIKPDNILVSENKAVLKVCDLGSAAEVNEGEITPYLVSRFYRAPEIILGLPYDMAIDIWSVGCTLFELYTGKILFPGRSNNHMLLLMMEVKGKLPHRMIKKSELGAMHFDENMNFVSVEKDKITGADVVKSTVINKATRDLRSRLLPSSSVQLRMKDDELRQLQQFVDLLEKCLMLDPARRISPREALLHPFVAGP
ncbi:U4/U6 small nuclear ribonucleoprotein prp4 [Cryptotrichosporon argae]